MNFAFCLFKYFPYGGLSRDCLRIAEHCVQRGHKVDIYTIDWQGELPAAINVHPIEVTGKINHRRYLQFANKVTSIINNKDYHCVVGFNKLPGLDIYFAADPCFLEKYRNKYAFFAKMSRRYQYFAAVEQELFKESSTTKILTLTEQQQQAFIKHYATSAERFHKLPPGVGSDRMANGDCLQLRQQLRQQLLIADDNIVLLLLGSGFKTKGLDRVLKAIYALPIVLRQQITLLVGGQDKTRYYQRLAKRLGIKSQVKFLGGVSDVPRLLQAADLLVHPAYHEVAGHVLLEALVAGLPVITSAICGYAHYVEQANMGSVIPEPFSQEVFNQLLQEFIVGYEPQLFKERGQLFAQRADIYRLATQAAQIIEQTAWSKHELSA